MENHCHLEKAVLLLDRMENRCHLVKAARLLDRMGNHYHLEKLVLVALEILALVVQADPEIWVVLVDLHPSKKRLQGKHLKQH